jgi:ribonucleoside-diphosphate reductase alpha chain
VNDGHLPVFDCAFKPARGVRSIHYMGHIKMVGATQPFLSGAISKTVNMPTEATIEDVERAYLLGWKLNLKAIAIYRDGCKRSQPLSTSKEAKKEVDLAKAEAKPTRRRMPDERQSITHKFSIAGHEGYITVGMYEDGSPGEVFMSMAKEGTVVSGLVDSIAIAISLALQHGVPLALLVEKFSHTRFEPSGFTGNRDIPMAKSILDYVFRWLSLKFLTVEQRKETELEAAKPTISTELVGLKSAGDTPANQMKFTFAAQTDAPPCSECGSIEVVRNGACYKCLNCGTSMGCS